MKNKRHTKILEKMSSKIMNQQYRHAFDFWRHKMFGVVTSADRVLKEATMHH